MKTNLKLDDARRAARLTGKELATRAGIAPNTFSRILTGRHDPAIMTAARIAKVLGVDPDEIFDRYGRQTGTAQTMRTVNRKETNGVTTCKKRRKP